MPIFGLLFLKMNCGVIWNALELTGLKIFYNDKAAVDSVNHLWSKMELKLLGVEADVWFFLSVKVISQVKDVMQSFKSGVIKLFL